MPKMIYRCQDYKPDLLEKAGYYEGVPIEQIFPPVDEKLEAHRTKRFAAPFVGVPFDRIDVDPIIIAHACVVLGYTNRDFYENPPLGAKCVIYCNELYDLLPVTHWFYSNVWLDALGCKMIVTESLPWIVQEPRPVQKPEDVDKIDVPDISDMEKCLTGELFIKCYDWVKEHEPQFFVPISYGFCHFGMAAEMVGPERFIIWCRRQKDVAHKLLSKVIETSANGAIMIARRYGFCMMTIGSVLSNSTVLSGKMNKEFAANYIIQMVKKAFKGGAGPQLWYHLCGDHQFDYMNFKEMVISPFTVIHIGYLGDQPFPADLLRETFGNMMTVMASVDTKIMMEPKNYGKIYEMAKDQLIKVREAPRGCILGTCCETPVPAPAGSILAMVRAAREYGVYGTW